MTNEAIILWLQASSALFVAALLQPWAAACVGAFVGGYTIGRSKNQTALAELGRGLVSGLIAFLVIWAVQRLLEGGVV